MLGYAELAHKEIGETIDLRSKIPEPGAMRRQIRAAPMDSR